MQVEGEEAIVWFVVWDQCVWIMVDHFEVWMMGDPAAPWLQIMNTCVGFWKRGGRSEEGWREERRYGVDANL